MREVQAERRVETVGRPPVTAAPQWQNLFLAPAYRGDMAADLDADWKEETAAPAALRRRRGRRPAHPAG
ncbi:hypothetical protein GTY23_03590 [Streptomyces sp. SID5998]|nr:hypothetical protein [Streptomyces sp. SID5998]